MGLTTSSVSPRKGERLNGIYNTAQLKWSPEQVAANIRNKVVSPIYSFATKTTGQTEKRCTCNVCYYNYPKINETSCCGFPICTECLAACAPKPPQKRICPGCRHENYTIIKEVDYYNLKNPVVNLDEPMVIDNPNLPDELIAIFCQYPDMDSTQKADIESCFKAGVPLEEIIQMINSQ